MSNRSLNKVMLIGNLTRDPELRYTPQGTAVATFGLATNRSWSTGDGGDRQEETQFHRIVAWSKLAEIVGQLLFKGRKVYIEGRLQTRKWTTPDGQQREVTEIVAENMMILDTRSRDGGQSVADEEGYVMPESAEQLPPDLTEDTAEAASTETKQENNGPKPKSSEETVSVDDIPF